MLTIVEAAENVEPAAGGFGGEALQGDCPECGARIVALRESVATCRVCKAKSIVVMQTGDWVKRASRLVMEYAVRQGADTVHHTEHDPINGTVRHESQPVTSLKQMSKSVVAAHYREKIEELTEELLAHVGFSSREELRASLREALEIVEEEIEENGHCIEEIEYSPDEVSRVEYNEDDTPVVIVGGDA